jgi:predicted RNase H-like HicB family nuclease
MTGKVWVVTVTQPEGCFVAVCETEEVAQQELQKYVGDWWEHEMGSDEVMPTDPQEAIDSYFESVEGEEGYISECDILTESSAE